MNRGILRGFSNGVRRAVGTWVHRFTTSQNGKQPAPLTFAAGSYRWKSEYGQLYKITGVAGSGGTTAGHQVGGGGGGGFILWWLGDGTEKAITVGSGGSPGFAGTTTSFDTLASATGGAASNTRINAGGTGTGAGINVTGQSGSGSVVAGCCGATYATGGYAAFGLGKGADGSTGGGGTGDNGTLIIEQVLPVFNTPSGAWQPGSTA